MPHQDDESDDQEWRFSVSDVSGESSESKDEETHTPREVAMDFLITLGLIGAVPTLCARTLSVMVGDDLSNKPLPVALGELSLGESLIFGIVLVGGLLAFSVFVMRFANGVTQYV